MTLASPLLLMPETSPSPLRPLRRDGGSMTDPLAGLPNRVLFHRLLEEALSDRQRSRVAVLCVQLTRFDRITATLGQHTGDRLLGKIARRLQDSLRHRDLVSRDEAFGSALLRDSGDRFTILLTDLEDEDGAAAVATRLLGALEPPFAIAGQELVVEASMGIAIQDAKGSIPAENLLRHAEIALFHAKDERESQHRQSAYRFFANSMDTSVRRALLIEAQLRSALQHDQLRVAFQPIFEPGTREVRALEALLRWHHPELGQVSPGEFIPIAEESGLIIDMGEWILREACAQVRPWLDASPDLRLCVNVSEAQFHDHRFVHRVEAALRELEFPAANLEFELTERGALMHDPNIVGVLHQLKSLGVGLSVDDFGTGNANFAYLANFPLDGLKIDRSFIQRIGQGAKGSAIVSGIIAMAQKLNLRVVAEGVEEEAQLAFLHGAGCDEVQGFLLARPACADQTEAHLPSRQPEARRAALSLGRFLST